MEPEADRTLAPYDKVPPGCEMIHTADDPSIRLESIDKTILPGYAQVIQFLDDDCHVCEMWSNWNINIEQKLGEWDDSDIHFINKIQTGLGPLNDDVRQVRAHIGNFVPCDNGVPVSIDDLLQAIARGKYSETPFHNGCCHAGSWWISKTTQPLQVESMVAIEATLRGYLDGKSSSDLEKCYPDAGGFIHRAFEWLGPLDEFSDLQKLLIKRALCPFEFLTKRNDDHSTVHEDCYGDDGSGKKIDEKIAELAGLPKIYGHHEKEYYEIIKTIDDPDKKELYKIMGGFGHGLHGLSDCHHSTFRWLEHWVHSIGTLKWGIPSRKKLVERERLGQLLFGYVIALDNWLKGRSMHFLLLDLGHIDLGFDPKNEILRVYAYLGVNDDPVKKWLAASLWWTILNNHPAGLKFRHPNFVELAEQNSISFNSWIDSEIK